MALEKSVSADLDSGNSCLTNLVVQNNLVALILVFIEKYACFDDENKANLDPLVQPFYFIYSMIVTLVMDNTDDYIVYRSFIPE